MMKKIAILVLLAITPILLGEPCGVRRITYAPAQAKELYYYQNGYYYKYLGNGHHGQLYYFEGGEYYPYKENIVLIPKAIQVEVHREHYYSIDSAYQQNLLADAIVGRLLRLQMEGKISTATPPSGGRLPTGPPTTTSPTGSSVGPVAQESKAGEFQNAALLKVVNDSCAKCHGATSKYTKLVTADGKLNDLPAGKVWECFGLVNTGEMPKGGKSLGDAEVKLFYEWAKNAKR